MWLGIYGRCSTKGNVIEGVDIMPMRVIVDLLTVNQYGELLCEPIFTSNGVSIVGYAADP